MGLEIFLCREVVPALEVSNVLFWGVAFAKEVVLCSEGPLPLVHFITYHHLKGRLARYVDSKFLIKLTLPTYIELIHGHHGDRPRVVAQLPHEGKVGHVPQNAGFVLQDKEVIKTKTNFRSEL